MTIRALLASTPSITSLLESSLTRYGFACTCVADGAAAAEEFARSRFDVVVLDTWLSKKQGAELAAEMRATLVGRSVGVCLINADPTGARDDALRRGIADAWFDIPFSTTDVRKKLAELAHRATGAVAEELPVAAPPGRRSLSSALGAEQTAAPTTSPAARGATAASAARAGPQSLAVKGAAAQLLELCRAQATGVLILKHRLAEARIAISRGMLVGCSDNGHDNRLGPRLLRRGKLQNADAERVQQWMQEHEGRIGDAVLGLGLLDAATLLDELRAQAHERLLQAAVWEEGEARFIKDEKEVLALAVDAFDVIDVVLRAYMRQPDSDAVMRFVTTRAEEVLSARIDFEEGLVAYARAEPRSPLPLVLMSASSTLSRVLASLTTFPPPSTGTYAAHLRALWKAGLVRLANDPPSTDGRPVPRPWKPDQVQAELLDANAIDAVQRTWLRVQGNDPYAALGVAPTATTEEITRALRALEDVAGRARLEGKRLGPAEAIARELADFFDETRELLLNPAARAAFDAARAAGNKGESGDALAAEELFLKGRLALVEQSVDKAIDSFREALKLAPDDAEMRAWLGWAEFFDAAERLANGIAHIKRAVHDNPMAARPLLFLARVSAQQGERAAAQRLLDEAARRCPDDPDVLKELELLQKR